MKRTGVRAMFIAVLIIQAAAILVVAGITAGQDVVKAAYYSPAEVLEVFSVPYGALAKTILPFVVYGIGFAVMNRDHGEDSVSAKAEAGIFVALSVVVALLTMYVQSVGNMYIGRMEGAAALASYASLESAATALATPFIYVAFALFAMACGRHSEISHE